MKKIKDIITNNKKDILAFGVIFAALILRISYFGFKYYPQLDDYIQYFNFPTSENYIQLILQEGLFASRPLAALCDLYIWAQMPLYISVAILSAMYALSGVLFLKVFKKYFSSGFFFLVFYTLLPLGYEGTYWISASARVIPGLFFTALTLYFFEKMLSRRKKIFLLPFMLSALLSFGFYEQLLVLSLALVLMTVLVNLIKKNYFSLWGLTVFVPLCAYFIFTGIFSADTSFVAGRMEIILPTSKYYFDTFLPDLVRQIGASFIKGGTLTLFKGLWRGIQLIFTEGVISAVLIVPVCAAVFFAAKKDGKEQKNKDNVLCALYGVLAALAPVTPFFIIANPWFSLRNTVASFVGAAIVADLVLRLIFKNKTALLCAVFSALCLISSVSELYDYKKTTENDLFAINAILQADKEYDLTGNVGILSLNSSALEEQNYKYHDHVVGVTNSDWSLYGAMVHVSGGELDFMPCPLSTDEFTFWVGWNKEIKNIARFDHLFYYDEKTHKLHKLTVSSSPHEHVMYFEDGSLCARVWDEGEEYGYVEIYQK